RWRANPFLVPRAQSRRGNRSASRRLSSTLVAGLTVTRSPIAAFDATPALPVFTVGAVNIRVDLFLADLTGHGLVMGGRLLSKPDALGRHDILFDHGALLAQDHLVLLLTNVRPGLGGTNIGV